ncbi:hypothetical protein BGZ83_011282 [Gryganskiella cystojenkinii]|nr:hypothetical protein BGZ83_011282 [Gryganskiella cystojenkinii]
MPTSLKTPRTPRTPRPLNVLDFGGRPFGTRWYGRRRFLLFFSVVLLISSGSLIVLRLSIDPDSSHTPSWARSRLSSSSSAFRNKNDHDQGTAKWNRNNNNHDLFQTADNYFIDRPVFNGNPYLIRGGQRPRIALPHHNVFRDEKELAMMQEQHELQEQQLRQLRQQILEQQREMVEPDFSKQLQQQQQNQAPATEQREMQELHHLSSDSNDNISGHHNHDEENESSLQGSNNYDNNNKNSVETDDVVDEKTLRLELSRQTPLPFTKLLPDPPTTDTRSKTNSRATKTRYLTYLPYAGITNQFYGMLRALEVAKALDRTLILPPITASSHDKSKQNQPWSKFLDLDRFRTLTGAKVVEYHELFMVTSPQGPSDGSPSQHPEDSIQEYHRIQCRITCGFGSKRTIDFTAKGFLKQWRLQETLVPLSSSTLSKDDTSFESIVASLREFDQDPYLCLSNTYKIAIKDKSEWDRFGQHLYFTTELEQFVQQFLNTKSRHSHYLAIHARRGDFAKYCEGNFPGRKMIHCLPSTSQFQDRIQTIQTQLSTSSASPLPVFVATNERDPKELAQFAELGWQVLDHATMRTVETLGVFGPMMVDQVFMANAQVLVGIQMSTFSRVGALRQKSWHNKEVEYM